MSVFWIIHAIENTPKIKVLQMLWKWNMIFFLKYLRIFGTENTAGGASTWPRGSRARPTPWARPLPRGPMVAILHSFLHPHTSSSSQKKFTNELKHEFKLILLPFSISLLKAPLTKLLWGIVLWYVTPPMVQLFFVLVRYSLQLFAA